MSDDDAYVHDPSAFEGDGAPAGAEDGAPAGAEDGAPAGAEDEEREERGEGEGDRTTAAYLDGDAGSGDADWRTWLLVAAVFVAFAVVPTAILFLPEARPVIAALGLTYRDAYLVLPLLPALVLGALAVWTAVANRRG
jgi:hypothetical protein